MKKLLMLLLAGLLACGEHEQDVAGEEDGEIWLGTAEQPITSQRTTSSGGVGSLYSGAMAAGSMQQCNSLMSSSTVCWVPPTKTINLYLNSDSESLRPLLNLVRADLHSQLNASEFSGTSWTVNVLPAGTTDSTASGLRIFRECSFDPGGSASNITSYLQMFGSGNPNNLAEPTPVNGVYRTNGFSDVRVFACKIEANFGTTAEEDRVKRHAMMLAALRLKAGIGFVPTSSVPASTVTLTTASGTTLRNTLPPAQRCLAKTLNVTINPTQFALTGSSFFCPAL